jgi:hypothetical protein
VARRESAKNAQGMRSVGLRSSKGSESFITAGDSCFRTRTNAFAAVIAGAVRSAPIHAQFLTHSFNQIFRLKGFEDNIHGQGLAGKIPVAVKTILVCGLSGCTCLASLNPLTLAS